MTGLHTPDSRRPDIVGIEITRFCNLTCPHCYTAAGRRPMNELTTPKLQSLIDQLIAIGPPRAIGWTGGEPLLREDLYELVEYAFARGQIRSGMTTNGLLLTPERARRLHAGGAYAIQISVDGSTPERNARMRNATIEDFATILAAMKAVKDAGLQLHLAMLLGKETLDDARNFLKLAIDNGADGVRFCGFVPAGRGRNDAVRRRLEFGDLDELREFVVEAQTTDSLMVMFDPAFGPLPPDYQFHECIAGKQALYVSSTGAVYPCTSLISPRFEVGNLRQRPLAEIWNDPRMTEVADSDCKHLTGHCHTCEHLNQCHGGCRGIAYAYTGEFPASFPRCLALAEPSITEGVHPPLSV